MIRKSVVAILSTALCVVSVAVVPNILPPFAHGSEVSSSIAVSSKCSSVSSSSIKPVSSMVSSTAVSSEKPVSSSVESKEEPRVSPYEQKQDMLSQLNPFDFKAEAARNMYYKDLNHLDILRNINSYIGTKVSFHGNVESLKRDPTTSTGLLSCGRPNYDDNFVISFSYDGYPNFIDADSVYLYGVITGTSQYHTEDGESHETFNVDVYFYDTAGNTENYQLTQEEQNYYYGNYTVYASCNGFYPFKIDANTINGHPYQVYSCIKDADSITIQFKFTEYPDSYNNRNANEQLDTVMFNLNGDIYTDIQTTIDTGSYYMAKGWNTEYGKPAWAIRQEKEVEQEQVTMNQNGVVQ